MTPIPSHDVVVFVLVDLALVWLALLAHLYFDHKGD